MFVLFTKQCGKKCCTAKEAMSFEWWISKATHTHTQNMKYLLFFHDNNSYADSPQYYLTPTVVLISP